MTIENNPKKSKTKTIVKMCLESIKIIAILHLYGIFESITWLKGAKNFFISRCYESCLLHLFLVSQHSHSTNFSFSLALSIQWWCDDDVDEVYTNFSCFIKLDALLQIDSDDKTLLILSCKKNKNFFPDKKTSNSNRRKVVALGFWFDSQFRFSFAHRQYPLLL